jgi:hypothetical protein
VLQEGAGSRKWAASVDCASLLQPELLRTRQHRLERIVSLSDTSEFAGANVRPAEFFVASQVDGERVSTETTVRSSA